MADDWRIRIEVEESGSAEGLLERLGAELRGEARELARELEERRLAVSRDGDTVFVYASSHDEAEKAAAVIRAELRESGIVAKASPVEHWLADEERWDDEPPGDTWEEDEIERGYAPWEVRVDCSTRDEARDLADRLEGEGYKPERRFQYVLVGVASREDAAALAARLHGSVEPGGELVWETAPGNPFAVFGGMGV
ncbi:MAG: SPOR domain-containing protein [Gaiellaceae bacterium]